MGDGRPSVVIVGGGFTGAVTAVHLARLSPIPLEIHIVEPREQLGAGLAYSSGDPDHRVNGPIEILALFKDDFGHFPRWYEQSGERSADPEALASTGQLYCRRAAFGRYMHALVREHAAANPSASRIIHHRATAADSVPEGQEISVQLNDGTTIRADHTVLAVAHERPATPPEFDRLAAHPSFITDPWAAGALEAVPAQGGVLVLGTALTTADIIATLLRTRPGIRVTAFSRRGLKPREQGVLPPAEQRLAKIARPTPLFVERHGISPSVATILKCLRADIRLHAAQGRGWEEAFDDLRDAAPVLWRSLPLHARQKVIRRLRGLYDIHRFRMAPQIAEQLREGERQGRLDFRSGRIVSAAATPAGFDVAISRRFEASERLRVGAIDNCTGPNGDASRSPNALVQALLRRGSVRPDPVGVGLDVDDACQSIGRDGRPDPGLTILGPLTRGHFGDLIAVPHINAQVLATVARLVGRLQAGRTSA